MVNKQLDKDGYILIPNEFIEHGFNIKFVEDLGDNWRIYSRQKTGFLKYELVKLKKQEEYIISNNVVPKKWKYPGYARFGFDGFELNTIEAARHKYKEILKYKQGKQDRADGICDIDLPDTEFTLKDLE